MQKLDFKALLPTQSKKTILVTIQEENIKNKPEFLPQAEIERIERENILAVLRVSAGKVYGKGGAAELLGIKPTTLASRMKAMGINQKTY